MQYTITRHSRTFASGMAASQKERSDKSRGKKRRLCAPTTTNPHGAQFFYTAACSAVIGNWTRTRKYSVPFTHASLENWHSDAGVPGSTGASKVPARVGPRRIGGALGVSYFTGGRCLWITWTWTVQYGKKRWGTVVKSLKFNSI